MAKTATDRYAMYVKADGQLDIPRIRKDHPCRGYTCRRCREETPCAVRWTADKLAAVQARGRQRGVGRVTVDARAGLRLSS